MASKNNKEKTSFNEEKFFHGEEKDNDVEIVEEKKSGFFSQNKLSIPKKTGKIANIVVGKYLVVEIDGNGVRVDYDADIHASLKKGDKIEI